MTTSRSRHLVDPGLRPLLDFTPSEELTEARVIEMRSQPAMLTAGPLDAEKVEQTSWTVPGPAGAPDVVVVVLRPLGLEGRLPCIFHIHGGGYIGGEVAQFVGMLGPLAIELGCVITSVNYRVAPETRFPGAIEDCYAALAWLVANADEMGIDPARIGLKGESAGGGLAAALALLVRDRGEYSLMFQNLSYPMLDDRTGLGEPHPYAGEFMWRASDNTFGWRAYLDAEPGSAGVSPYAAPARAESLASLPPTYIHVGALDLFIEENIEYGRRLIRAGVPCELHVYPGGVHGFDAAPLSPISVAARRDMMDWLRRFIPKHSPI